MKLRALKAQANGPTTMDSTLQAMAGARRGDGLGANFTGVVIRVDTMTTQSKKPMTVRNYKIAPLPPKNAPLALHFQADADLTEAKGYVDIPCLRAPTSKGESTTIQEGCWGEVLEEMAENERKAATMELQNATEAIKTAPKDATPEQRGELEAAAMKAQERLAAALALAEEAKSKVRSMKAWYGFTVSARQLGKDINESIVIGSVVQVHGQRINLYSYKEGVPNKTPGKIQESNRANSIVVVNKPLVRAIAEVPFEYKCVHGMTTPPTRAQELKDIVGDRLSDPDGYPPAGVSIFYVCGHPSPTEEMMEAYGPDETRVVATLDLAVPSGVDPDLCFFRTVKIQDEFEGPGRYLRGVTEKGEQANFRVFVMEGANRTSQIFGTVYDNPSGIAMLSTVNVDEWKKFGRTLMSSYEGAIVFFPAETMAVEDTEALAKGEEPGKFISGKMDLIPDVAATVRYAGIRVPPDEFLNVVKTDDNLNNIQSMPMEFEPNSKGVEAHKEGKGIPGQRAINLSVFQANLERVKAGVETGELELWMVSNHRGFSWGDLESIRMVDDWASQMEVYLDPAHGAYAHLVGDASPEYLLYVVCATNNAKDIPCYYAPKNYAPKKQQGSSKRAKTTEA